VKQGGDEGQERVDEGQVFYALSFHLFKDGKDFSWAGKGMESRARRVSTAVASKGNSKKTILENYGEG